ncbi:hypothetical protein HBH92_063200 [Parastagonospora nodorum]|nr:hypothetical protein HBH92_063200 [Parastagonospora nodorum]KAH4424310.1 hypothetical protein HBH93_188000 [Parastagonospora nodorum]KAH4457948.1 hypothetical protein HBH91_084460 [Parastagonospora nodorum]KAH4511435.1 hypothetical protein HBH89_043690 [Parastagonospora nodorum]KAH4549333.1 hypothetical protein HBH85_056540 [Parastagonospora nodorum]
MSFPNLPPPSAGLPARPPPMNASFAQPSGPQKVFYFGSGAQPTTTGDPFAASKESKQAPAAVEPLDARHPRSVLRNFLAGGNFGFKGHAQHNLKAHGEYLLATPLGRDFALVTSVGVVFKVHAMMLLGGSKKLQNSIFPGDTSSSTPAASVDLPATLHPVLMDRVIEFIYTGTYADSEFPELRLIQNATSFPEGSEAVSFARPDLVGAKFHMHMCAVAEELEFPSLYALAHNKMADLVAGQFVLPFRLAELVGAAFAPRDSELRVCEDREGWMQKLLVTAVLAQEGRHWSQDHKQGFGRALVGDEYNVFWDMYEDVKADCVDLLERASDTGSKSKSKGKGKGKPSSAHEGGVQKRTAAKKKLLEKRSAALVSGLERMGVAEDMEL